MNVDFPENFILPLSTRKVRTVIFIVKEVARSFDRKMIKLLTFDMNLVFHHHNICTKTHNRDDGGYHLFPPK